MASLNHVSRALLGCVTLLLVTASSAQAGSLQPDADCPGLVCSLSTSALDVTIDVWWQPDTSNLGFVDVFTDWYVTETDPDDAIAGVPVGSNPAPSGAFTISLTNNDPSVPHTASVGIQYASQLRPQNDPQGLGCATSGLCVDYYGSQTYTISIDAIELPEVRLGTQAVGEGVDLDVYANSKEQGGYGDLVGGRVHSPGGTPDLFFRTGATPTFPGTLETFVEWAAYGNEDAPGIWTPLLWEGAEDGHDNWMKVIRDSDGAVSWTRFTFDGSIGASAEPILTDIPFYVSYPDGRDFSLGLATVAARVPQVTAGTHGLADGVELLIVENRKGGSGFGALNGARVHSPSGTPDLFFRANSTPTFPGPLVSLIYWSDGSDQFDPGVWYPFSLEGAVHGSDNWMKLVRDADGAVSWAQLVLDFSPGAANDPILLDVLLYVARPDGSDLSLAEAVAAVPEPGLGLMLAAGVAGLATARRRNAGRTTTGRADPARSRVTSSTRVGSRRS